MQVKAEVVWLKGISLPPRLITRPPSSACPQEHQEFEEIPACTALSASRLACGRWRHTDVTRPWDTVASAPSGMRCARGLVLPRSAFVKHAPDLTRASVVIQELLECDMSWGAEGLSCDVADSIGLSVILSSHNVCGVDCLTAIEPPVDHQDLVIPAASPSQ